MMDANADANALACRYQHGDADALAALSAQLQPHIGAVVARCSRRPLPPSLTVEDLRQQSWVILATLARRWQPTGSFLSYVLNAFERELRRYVARHWRVSPQDWLQDHTATCHESPAESVAVAGEYLLRLPARERFAVAAHVLLEQDCATIAHTLGVSRATSFRLCRRGLAQLREGMSHV
jgi:RNA polymerase sigma factor (sigma-70 family)